jgi:hypothetical protein
MAQLMIHPHKADRSRIDLSDDGIAKQWVKKLGKTREEIATAIAKVGDNAETVMKELRVERNDKTSKL